MDEQTVPAGKYHADRCNMLNARPSADKELTPLDDGIFTGHGKGQSVLITNDYTNLHCLVY